MENLNQLIHFDGEIILIKMHGQNKVVVFVTREHLENIAWACLCNPVLVCELELEMIIDLFKKAPLDDDFLELWKFEYSTMKDDFNVKSKFSLPLEIPKNPSEIIQFWSSLQRSKDPIYYASAVLAAWGLEGSNNTIRNIASFWIKQETTPFFSFNVTKENFFSNKDLPKELKELSNEIKEFLLRQFLVIGNLLDLSYMKYLYKKNPERIAEIQNLINPEIIEPCYN